MAAPRFADSIHRFHAHAAQARGLEDFGSDDYREALGVLCASLDEDATLSPVGVVAFETMITDALEARLLCEEGWRRTPEAADHRVEAPLFIVGLPRTGTTVLHHLLAQDPQVQALEHWLARTPRPRPPRDAWPSDADFRFAEARVDEMFARAPEMRAIHQIEAHLPDECWNLFSQTFLHSSWEANADVRGFARWWAGRDLRAAYARHRRNVQLIGHRESDRTWVFKDATHLFDLDALFAVYPDARIVHTHRDPTALVPSVCSLCWAAREPLGEGLDREGFGRSTLELWGRAIDATLSARARRDATRFHDLSFERFVADPIAAVGEIYDHFGRSLTAAAEDAMRAFLAAHPKDRHGEHVYAASDWGLSPDAIQERFAHYVDAFDLAPEATS